MYIVVVGVRELGWAVSSLRPAPLLQPSRPELSTGWAGGQLQPAGREEEDKPGQAAQPTIINYRKTSWSNNQSWA